MGGSMIASLLLLAAGQPGSFEPTRVAVDHETVRPSDLRVGVGDSVRAATWDELQEKPNAPVTIRMACMVMKPFGVPGGCVPADSIPAGQAQVNLPVLTEQVRAARAERSTLELELERIAEKRIRTSRLVRGRSDDQFMVIHLFEVVIDPADARPIFDTDNPLALADVSFARPLDASLIQSLFPVLAMRESFGARVRITCRIQPSLDLLCRDVGTVTPVPAQAFQPADPVTEDFRLATYQIASTIKLEPKTKSGADVVGRNLVISISWVL